MSDVQNKFLETFLFLSCFALIPMIYNNGDIILSSSKIAFIRSEYCKCINVSLKEAFNLAWLKLERTRFTQY